MANQWFRLYSEFATDPKVQMLSEFDQRRFIMLLCVRCNGFVTLHDAEVAFHLRISNDDWAETKARLVERKLITKDNNPAAWDKRQAASDSSTERVRRYRERARNNNETLQQPFCNAVDKIREKEKEKKEKGIATVPVACVQKPVPLKPDKPETLLAELGVPNAIAVDWLAMRKAKRALPTDTAIKGIAREAEKSGRPLADVLATCCERGWIGFKADWVKDEKPPGGAEKYESEMVTMSNGQTLPLDFLKRVGLRT